jgi:hypothetical protein
MSINIKVIAEVLDAFAFVLVAPEFLRNNTSILSFSLYLYNKTTHILRNRRLNFFLLLGLFFSYMLVYLLANFYIHLHMSFLNKPLLHSYILTEIVSAIILFMLAIFLISTIITVILLLVLYISYIGPFLAVRTTMFFGGVILFFIARVLSIWWYATTGPA